MTLPEFRTRFETDEACRQHLMARRWPNGFVCPRCENHRGWLLRSRPLVQCARCGYQASVTAATIFHGSHTPLHKWLMAIYLVAQDKRGISALRLAEMIDVCQETAWLMLRTLRRAMADRDAQHMLEGTIEMDDAFFGGEDRAGNVGRGTT